MLDRQLLLSLHRHWTWADRQRELFVYYLRHDFPTLSEADIGTPAFFTSSMFTSMALWYGLLYAVCEGIIQAAGQPPEILGAHYSQVRGYLRDFRNAVFHVQPKYWSSKFARLLVEDGTSDSIRALHNEIGAWIAKHIADTQSV